MGDDNILYYHKVLGHLIGKNASKYHGKHDKKSMTKFMSIDYIYDRSLENKETYAKDIGKHFGLNKSTTSEMIKSLQSEGMIEMIVDSNDARLKKLVLTNNALNLVKQERTLFEEFYSQVTNNLTKEEIETYINISKKMIENLKEED